MTTYRNFEDAIRKIEYMQPNIVETLERIVQKAIRFTFKLAKEAKINGFLLLLGGSFSKGNPKILNIKNNGMIQQFVISDIDLYLLVNRSAFLHNPLLFVMCKKFSQEISKKYKHTILSHIDFGLNFFNFLSAKEYLAFDLVEFGIPLAYKGDYINEFNRLKQKMKRERILEEDITLLYNRLLEYFYFETINLKKEFRIPLRLYYLIKILSAIEHVNSASYRVKEKMINFINLDRVFRTCIFDFEHESVICQEDEYKIEKMITDCIKILQVKVMKFKNKLWTSNFVFRPSPRHKRLLKTSRDILSSLVHGSFYSIIDSLRLNFIGKERVLITALDELIKVIDKQLVRLSEGENLILSDRIVRLARMWKNAVFKGKPLFAIAEY